MEKNGRAPQKACTPKAIFVLLLFIVLGIASLIVIVILTVKKDNYYDSYYISDFKEEIEEGTNRTLKYRIVDVSREHYICDLKDDVKRTHVRYYNRYGIEIAADLYTSKNIDKNKQNKGIVIGPPYGGVKEQGPSVYANELASRGFVVLAFDPSFNGESGGKARKVSSSDIFMEDFSAGVDYLGKLSYVDREKIGGIGICGSGGFLLGAAVIDVRIKAVVTIVMYDIPGLNNHMNDSEYNNTIMDLKKARWEELDKGKPEVQIIYEPDREYENDSYPSGPNEEFETIWRVFYSTKRGHHPRSTGGFTSTSMFSIGNIPVTTNIDKIAPRPILFITGDIAHSRNYTEEAYSRAEQPKELYIVNMTTTHIDLYDNVTMIPFDEIDNFFNENLDKEFY